MEKKTRAFERKKRELNNATRKWANNLIDAMNVFCLLHLSWHSTFDYETDAYYTINSLVASYFEINLKRMKMFIWLW